MNVITFEKAYCLFPRATLDDRLSLVCTSRQDDTIEAVFQKYTTRGWNIIRSVDDIEHVTQDPALDVNQRRWIDDRYTWSINRKKRCSPSISGSFDSASDIHF